MQVESWDYRFSNLCNFSCRMCGDMLSSSWLAENRKSMIVGTAKEATWNGPTRCKKQQLDIVP